MKSKKIFLLFAAFIFVAVAGYNIHLAQSNQNSDMSLADIAVMAQANGEINPDCPNGCVACGNGCWCYGWHRYDREFNWGD